MTDDSDIPLLGPTTHFDAESQASLLQTAKQMQSLPRAPDQGVVESAEYSQIDNANDTLKIALERGEVVYVANGAFSIDNPALCTLAYLGASPSRLEEAEGEDLPLVVNEGGNFAVPMHVVEDGKDVLRELPWCPEDGRDTVEEVETS